MADDSAKITKAKESLEDSMEAYVQAVYTEDYRVVEFAVVIESVNLETNGRRYLYGFKKNNNLATIEGMVRKLVRWIEANH